MTHTHLDHLIQLETQVWQALVDGDAVADAEMLADDFLGVFPTGFADRADHARQLQHGPTVASFELTEPRSFPVGDDAVMLSYLARYRRVTPDGHGELEEMYVSSLWCHRDAGWMNIFSQDTPRDEANPVP
ncbi:MAG: nuclear transport factor 2 family protein [Acidimicrobiales bacterium]|nr:nuclear transport factor 2 family protein [Acidimicrobiales bacterium]RZV46950.1 MAG: nuclear transport factor 2 family protein [Acidimicrobiales bacterium]